MRHLKTAALLILLLLTAPARASDEQEAVTAQAADIATTAAGLALGAAEANPLGLLTLGAKALAYQQIKASPEIEQSRLWSAYSAFGWGATANNLCVIAAIASGGAAGLLCPAIGAATAVLRWESTTEQRDREQFAAICQQEQQKTPTLRCVWSPRGTE